MLAKGWKLKKIHDLPELLDEAVRYSPGLEEFRSLCEEATVFYFEAKYPFFKDKPAAEEVNELLIRVKEMVKLILEEFK